MNYMSKKIKIPLLVLILVILGYVLYPKYTGSIEKSPFFAGGTITLGQYYRCFGMQLTQKEGNEEFYIERYRCIGIPFGEITI